jgi:hypothetical protein
MQATHEGSHTTDQIDVNGIAVYHRVYGIMDGDKFVPLRTDDLPVDAADIATLVAPNAQGKPAGAYRNTDIRSMALAAEARRKAAAPAAVSPR